MGDRVPSGSAKLRKRGTDPRALLAASPGAAPDKPRQTAPPAFLRTMRHSGNLGDQRVGEGRAGVAMQIVESVRKQNRGFDRNSTSSAIPS